jgi:hypothetical protein
VNTIFLLINLAALVCALLILWRAEPALARMSAHTDWMIRYAMLLLAGGALAVVFAVLGGRQIDGGTLLILAGIALLLICERRLRYLVRPRPGDRHA